MRNSARARAVARLAGAVACAVAASWLFAEDASAFCRTTTSNIPADFQPSVDQCWTQGLPLWWRNACVGYSIQKDASRQVSYDDASNAIALAFSKWTSTTCPTNGTGPSRVSIDVRDLGPVDCGAVQYNTDQPNQHVIVFRDNAWPHNDANNTLALTTVVFNPDTGEIYDADMEINTAQVKVTLQDPVPMEGYDFASIVTHETGHFLGMAHSGDIHATMYAHYNQGSTAMRSLTSDDVAGICTIYPPDGTRSVATSVASSGSIAEDSCDPTPRHGFSTECASPQSSSKCSVSAAGAPGSAWACACACAAACAVAIARRGRRRAHRL
jgi:hypothetical protein